MKYLRKYETEADIDIDVTPNVVLVNDTKKVLYNYNPPLPLGVFIQHVDGKLYTTDEWTAKGFSNDEANGVAVSTEECAFVIAKEDAIGDKMWTSNRGTLIEGIITTKDSNVAKNDYRGKENTDLILVTDTSEAVYSCANFLFPNGAKGYCPALGEFDIVAQNYTEIKRMLEIIGGRGLKENTYTWSSTPSDAWNAWAFSVNRLAPQELGKSYYCRARPFTTLSPSDIPSEEPKVL